MRSSFAPPELLVQNAMANYDPHFLFLVTNNSSKPIMERVKGLVVFSQDTTVKSEPIVNTEDALMDIKRETKVLLHQLSAVDEELQEEIMDIGLDFIWKTMHCQAIRVQLHHYEQLDEASGAMKLKGNEALKNFYKKRVFRWKTLKNEMSTG